MHGIIAASNNLGFPEILPTMTSNPYWKEITKSLEPGQTSKDRAELCNRLFRMKTESSCTDSSRIRFLVELWLTYVSKNSRSVD